MLRSNRIARPPNAPPPPHAAVQTPHAILKAARRLAVDKCGMNVLYVDDDVECDANVEFGTAKEMVEYHISSSMADVRDVCADSRELANVRRVVALQVIKDLIGAVANIESADVVHDIKQALHVAVDAL